MKILLISAVAFLSVSAGVVRRAVYVAVALDRAQLQVSRGEKLDARWPTRRLSEVW
jgi:hypothetical protein